MEDSAGRTELVRIITFCPHQEYQFYLKIAPLMPSRYKYIYKSFPLLMLMLMRREKD